MSIASAILGFFGLHSLAEESRYVRRTLLSEQLKSEHAPVACEVDSEAQRYTAKRYISAMLEWENDLIAGRERRGFKEWQKYLLPMMIHRREEYERFIDEVGMLMEAGEWKPVLTAEQQEEKRRNILARKDEIMAESLRPMHHDASMSGVDDDEDAAPVSEEERDAVIAKALAEAGIEPWPEMKIEDGDDNEEDDDEGERIEEGQQADEGQEGRG